MVSFNSAEPGWPDRAIGEIAGRQRTMISRPQLLGLDLAQAVIDRAVRRNRLYRVHNGVYSVVPERARPQLAAEQAALLACGPNAVLSHASALKVHGFRLAGPRARIHVTVPGSARRRPGIVVHATKDLHAQERNRIDGLAVTSIARALIDLAQPLTDQQLEPLIDQALRKTSRTRILEALARHPRRPGTPHLKRLLDPERPSADWWSRQEARLRAMIARAGLPAPESNIALGVYVADLLWREHRLIVEYDSYDFHSGPAAFHHDRTRHNDLEVHGRFRVLHVTRRQVHEEPEKVLVWIAVALAQSEWGVR